MFADLEHRRTGRRAARAARHPARRRPHRVVGANWLWAVTVPLFAFAPDPLVLGLLFAVMLCIAPIWNVTVVAYRMAIVPPRLQARVQSVALLIAMSLTPLAPPVAGYLSDHVGAREAILLIACWSLALAIGGSLSRAAAPAAGRARDRPRTLTSSRRAAGSRSGRRS